MFSVHSFTSADLIKKVQVDGIFSGVCTFNYFQNIVKWEIFAAGKFRLVVRTFIEQIFCGLIFEDAYTVKNELLQ